MFAVARYTDPMQSHDPVRVLKGATPALVHKLNRLGIATIRDLLFHFPSRYEDFSNVKNIEDLALGEVATIQARIREIKASRAWKRKMFISEAVLEDDTGFIRAVWFNQPYLAKTFRAGDRLSVSGKLSRSPKGAYFANPAYERLSAREEATHTSGLVPVYPVTTGLTPRWLRYLVKQALPLAPSLAETLPAELRAAHQLPPLAHSLAAIHFPSSLAEAERARTRFVFEEILLIQLRVLRERKSYQNKRAPEIPTDLTLIRQFVSSLSFPLTNAQRRASWEIVRDTAKPVPMNRLLEGDVGSGKTVVAVLVALNAVRAGFQVAYLAPTEILATQHFRTFASLLDGFQISLGLLTASQKMLHSPLGETSKIDAVSMAGRGEVDILIGTHALIQDKVRFARLGLVIVDEQHRFGVDQRAHLERRGSRVVPHFLSMTATPIPRTLALTVYGDLDVSVLDQLPSGRKAVITKLVPEEKRAAAYQFIREEIRRGRQVFVICPRIELAEHQDVRHTAQELFREEAKSVKAEHEVLSKKIFPDFRVAMLHGKMKPKEKEAVMRSFKEHRADILVSTSVVEVGVDVPNATVMLIDGAEKFGLAQIHQFRGRVGRGAHQSYCFLMTTTPSSESSRLKAVVSAKNGFELAEKDLAIRGPGDFLGTRQSGIPPFAFKGLGNMRLVQSAREAAEHLLARDPELKAHRALSERLQAFERTVHLE